MLQINLAVKSIKVISPRYFTTLMNPSTSPASVSRENVIRATSGAVMLAVNLTIIVTGIVLFIFGVKAVADTRGDFHYSLLLGPFLSAMGVVLLLGHFTLQPNEGRVLILFGR